jgi:type II secretory pathway pseudopilin PulG
MNDYYYRRNQSNNTENAFTITEAILIFFIIGVLGAVLFFIVNPKKNYAESRNTERQVDVTDIANSLRLYLEENNSLGKLEDKIPSCPQTANISKDEIDLESILVTKYLNEMPSDPKTGSSTDTGYDICKEPNDRFVISAPDAENNAEIEFKN